MDLHLLMSEKLAKSFYHLKLRLMFWMEGTVWKVSGRTKNPRGVILQLSSNNQISLFCLTTYPSKFSRSSLRKPLSFQPWQTSPKPWPVTWHCANERLSFSKQESREIASERVSNDLSVIEQALSIIRINNFRIFLLPKIQIKFFQIQLFQGQANTSEPCIWNPRAPNDLLVLFSFYHLHCETKAQFL